MYCTGYRYAYPWLPAGVVDIGGTLPCPCLVYTPADPMQAFMSWKL